MSLLSVLLLIGNLPTAFLISTSTPVPPLQWLELTNLLGGDKPPALKDASIGYDEASRSVILFGGESDAGVAQSQTYLLDLDTLTWSRPTPPSTLNKTPPARTRAVSGVDYAASYRQGFVVIGGQSATGASLADVWEFDFNNQFWAQVSVSDDGPKVWGAAGGIDHRIAPVQDISLPVPNNTFCLAGGFDGNEAQPLSDVWRLHISGTLSSNLPDSVVGSWEKVDIATMPSNINVSSTVISNKIVIGSGCATDPGGNNCMLQETYVVDTETRNVISPDPCLPPRRGTALTSNLNSASESFLAQAFMFLGIEDTEWDNQGGSKQGEVAVLDAETGTWARVLPAGDPGDDGTEVFPTPREGAAVVGSNLALAGSSRTASSDYFVFGGRDAAGGTLSEVWLLRSYLGSLDSDDEKWSGYGDGNLETGVNARGSGVAIHYIPECASRQATPTTSPSTGSPTVTETPTETGVPQSAPQGYNISPSHKILAPLSISLILPAVALMLNRLGSPKGFRFDLLSCLSVFILIGAYALGIAGLTTAFTTISLGTQNGNQRREFSARPIHLHTVHSQVGLAFFIALYGIIIPLIVLKWLFTNRGKQCQVLESSAPPEKEEGTIQEGSQGFPWTASSGTNHHRRTPSQSWSLWRSSEGQLSPDNVSTHSITSAPSHPSFQVTNRPSRQHYEPKPRPEHPAELSQIDWLTRRRTLNAVGELDYALTQALKNRPSPNTPNTTDLLVTKEATVPSALPTLLDIFLHVLFHVSLLGLIILSMVMLWARGPRTAFAVLLVWVVLFYILIGILLWIRRPSYRLSRPLAHQNSPSPLLSDATSPSQPLSHIPNSSPYTQHRPSYQVSHSLGHDTFSHEGTRHPEDDHDNDDDDELNDDERQQQIEAEMARRDVSILTVPRRKLWVANPSSS